MSTCKVVLRTENKKKSGLCPIYLRIIISRQKKDYALNLEATEEQWDFKKNNLKRSAPFSGQRNTIIQMALNKAENIFVDFQLKGLPINHLLFKQAFTDKKESTNNFTFEEVARDIINGYIGKFSYASIRNLRATVSKTNKFRPNVMLNDLDYQFFVDFEYYMRNSLKNGSNTVCKTIYCFSRILNSAEKLKYIEKNPLENYTVKKVPSEKRVFLEYNEIKKLESLLYESLSPKLKNTLLAFLFACYTSLRYGDMLELKKEHIENNEIKLRQHKTKEYVSIPLSNQAKAIIALSNSNNDYLFKMYTNQKMNDYLKVLALRAGIEKNISFHVARHSFATISLNLGIRMEVVSSLLGHTSLKTTAIYAKLLDKTKHEEMKKWEGIG